MTSANVVMYSILKDDIEVGSHRVNIMCKSNFDKLLVYEPLTEYEILPYGYDEEEDYWEGEIENLSDFLKSLIPTNKEIREYFN